MHSSPRTVTTEQQATPHTQDTCILLFAKYPAPHMAKTRLQPVLGVDGAARMARQLLRHSAAQAVATGFVVELCVSPAPSDPRWHTLDLPDSLRWSAQVDGDLGSRMLIASQRALARFKKVMLIGTDCPSLTAACIQTAACQLDWHDAVMIPATDGGYVLLGFNQVDESLFSDMIWSTASVAAVTRQRIAALGWTIRQLAPLHDIDEPTDLQYLPADWRTGSEV